MTAHSVAKQKIWPRHMPLVTIVIPCFNYGRYVRDAVRSALSQTLIDLEVIVVDDGSTDIETLHVLNTLKAEGIPLISQRNLGLPAARNAGVRRAKGKYVCCLDADDMIEPTYIEKAVALLECRPDVGFTYPWPRRFGQGEGIWENPEYDFLELLERNILNHPAVFRRQAWKDARGFWDKLREGYEDWEFWIHLGIHGYPGARIPEPLFLYRKHGPSMIDRAVAKHDALVARIRHRHRRVYYNQRARENVRQRFRNRHVDTPFLNLARSDQYPHGSSTPFVLVTEGPPPGPVVKELVELRQERATLLYWIATAPSKACLDLSWRPPLTHSYFLADFLPKYAWAAFVVNLAKTRAARAIWMGRSALTETLLAQLLADRRRPQCVLFAAHGEDADWLAALDLLAFDAQVRPSEGMDRRLSGFAMRVIGSAPAA